MTTAPPDIVAVAIAELPSPVIVKVGAELYPEPGLSIAYPTTVSYTHLTLPTRTRG